LWGVGTKATGPSSIFGNQLALLKTTAEDEAYRATIRTTNKRLQLKIHLADADIEDTTWSFTNPECVTRLLE
jgi:hypothetical protein